MSSHTNHSRDGGGPSGTPDSSSGAASRKPSDAYLALMGGVPKRIPHYEHLSNPEFEALVTGMDPYRRPRSTRRRLLEIYTIDLGVPVPDDDTPISRPDYTAGAAADAEGRLTVRWGAGESGHWDWGRQFHSIEDVLSYEPLKNLDLRDETVMPVVENRDYSLDDEAFYEQYARGFPWTVVPTDEVAMAVFYNTLFMWPLLTFGWELFLELAAGHHDELRRLLGDFAVINRKVFRTFARLPVNVVLCHDDICMASGPVCSPEWLREFIYPYYEEFWVGLHAAGKKVIFMCDGNIDKVADDVVACGADGLISEPYTDWKKIAARHPGKALAGEGDNRVLMQGRRADIEAMVRSMVETARGCPGYFMCVGNHIPWNIPPASVKLYFGLCRDLAHRS